MLVDHMAPKCLILPASSTGNTHMREGEIFLSGGLLCWISGGVCMEAKDVGPVT